ncbi:hypothetical protein C8R44DRAFT_314274 [Mycena epipterygia]|nr:hypothetical protein C8R44DRAFT_314274 [Mycena epipterygia]
MLGSITATNELKEKKKLLKKGKKLGRDKDDYDQLEEDAEQFVFVGSCSTQSGEEDDEKWVGRNAHESLESITEKDVRHGSSPSTSTSSDAGSGQWAIASMHSEPSRKGKVFRTNRQVSENTPPSPAARRQSFDLSSRGSASSTPDLKRSTSLWHHQQPRAGLSDDAAGEFQDRYLRNFGTGTMSDRRRTLNVKRARKMAQVFGQEPPSELIQIHDEREIDHFRDSTATLLSTYLTVAPPLRDRANSTSSTGTTGHEVEVEVEEEHPPTPPPFSTTHTIDDPQSTVTTLPPTSSFQDRRRRAAKLSRFFGVGYQDISLSPDTAVPPPVPIADVQVEVDVKVSGRRFWSFNDRSKDGDMQEAIQKLRGLKAS